MQFPMPIRNTHTGEEKNFYDAQVLADFLAGEPDATVWDGRSDYGVLPAPSFAVELVEVVVEVVEARAEVAAEVAGAPAEVVEAVTEVAAEVAAQEPEPLL